MAKKSRLSKLSLHRETLRFREPCRGRQGAVPGHGPREDDDQAIDMVLKVQTEGNPQLKQVEDVMRTFLTKYLIWENIEPQMVQMYAEAFTEPEVRELIVFYRTPLGQKTVARMPELMQKGTAMGQKAVQDHLPELQEAIAKKMQESGGTPEKP